MSTDRRNERGATLVLVSFAFVGVVIMAALVIDLAALRNDRAANQISADSAAAAAAGVLQSGGGPEACQLALDYLEELSGGPAITGIDCTVFPVICTTTTSSVAATGTSGSLSYRLVYPVVDADPLMVPGAIGASPPSVTLADGFWCDRFGVEITETHTTFFGRVVGVDTLQSSIHAVALAGIDTDVGRALNLLLLEPHDCGVLSVSGGGGTKGGIIVNPVIDDINGRVLPGSISVDSDGTGACSSKGVINADGTGAVIRADGLPGCPGELVAEGPGAGCGDLEVFAPGGPGCLMPACSSTGLVAPAPTRVDKPLTRSMVDWRYNCKSSYPIVGVSRCPNWTARPPYIDSLVAAVGPAGIPPGFRSYTAAGYPCSVSDDTPLLIPADNWVVDCDLRISEELRFQGGNIIFDGQVRLSGQAQLRFNSSNSNSFHWVENSPLDITDHSGRSTFVYLRDGTMSKGSQAHIELDQTLVYVSATSSLDVGGGSGSLRWIAPTTGPFEDLALWSETAADHQFGGGSSLELEGVLFAPHADFNYSGNGTQQQVAAQFISRRLSTSGAGLLVLEPVSSRAVLFPFAIATLIR